MGEVLLCTGCGGIGPIEDGLARVRATAVRVHATVGAWFRRWAGRHGAWLLAATPLVIGPPLLVLLLAGLRRLPAQAAPPSPWLLALATTNVVLSLVAWSMISDGFGAALAGVAEWGAGPTRWRQPPAGISI